MLIVSDVHGAFDALERVARSGEPLLVLGDLLNFIDYRTGEGIAAEVFGAEFAQSWARHRATGDYEASREQWSSLMAGREEEIRASIDRLVDAEYRLMAKALAGSDAFVTFGNVDWPERLEAALPEGTTYVDGSVIEIEGLRIGIVGGGAPTPVRGRGEVSHEVMAEKLARLGPVDILCSHLPPTVEPLNRDVITGRLERSSPQILSYLHEYQPRFHYFGDIHQPQARRWVVGNTVCVNVGYFRATGTPVRHPT